MFRHVLKLTFKIPEGEELLIYEFQTKRINITKLKLNRILRKATSLRTPGATLLRYTLVKGVSYA